MWDDRSECKKSGRQDSDASVLKGSEQEIIQIYESCFRGIYNYCSYRLFRKDLAEEATSEVFVRLVEKYPTLLDRGKTGIRNWLYGTASNVIAKYLRDSKRLGQILKDLAREKRLSSVRNPKESDRLDCGILYNAISKLKLKDQGLIVLRYFEGLETAAIADILGVKHVSVRVRLSRAVNKLRQELEKPFATRH